MSKQEKKTPKYRCTKEVSAMKLFSIRPILTETKNVTIEIAEYELELLESNNSSSISNLVERTVTREFIDRYNPKPGDYFIEYEDGHEIILPEGTFNRYYSKKNESCEHESSTEEIRLEEYKDTLHLIERAEKEIKYPERRNEILSAKMEMFDNIKSIIGKVNPEQCSYSGFREGSVEEMLIVEALEAKAFELRSKTDILAKDNRSEDIEHSLSIADLTTGLKSRDE